MITSLFTTVMFRKTLQTYLFLTVYHVFFVGSLFTSMSLKRLSLLVSYAFELEPASWNSVGNMFYAIASLIYLI